MSGQMNPDARAAFLASLEYGVNPLLGRDLYQTDEDARDAQIALEAYREYISGGRSSRPWIELAREAS